MVWSACHGASEIAQITHFLTRESCSALEELELENAGCEISLLVCVGVENLNTE